VRVSTGQPLFAAAENNDSNVMRCLVNELGADVNQADRNGVTVLHCAAMNMVQILLSELNADVDKAHTTGSTALIFAASRNSLNVVRCLVREFGADINHPGHDGITALMAAANCKHAALTKWLVKAGADPQAKNEGGETAATISRTVGASPEQIAYLEAKAHCGNPGCSGAGTKKCQGCMHGRYCGPACHVAHWPEHRATCRRLGAALKSTQDEGGSREH
jgi:ankyrin repeat protein